MLLEDFTDDWQVCQLKYSPQVARIWEFFLNKKKNSGIDEEKNNVFPKNKIEHSKKFVSLTN